MSRRAWVAVFLLVVAASVGLALQPSPLTEVRSCVRADAWPKLLFHLTNAADLRIFVAYVWISAYLLWLRPRLGIPLGWIFLFFAAFIVSCGLTHAVSVLTGYVPWYWLAYDVKEVTADVSIATAVVLQFVAGPQLAREAEKYRKALEAERARTEEERRGREAEAGERKAAQDVAEQLRQALDREQALAQSLAESSAPILRLPNRTIALVVVGSVAAERAQSLMVRACYAVQEERAKGVIIDVSAVPMMDTSAVAALGQVAQSVANMGARVVFAGIKAEIAMAMARMGVTFVGGSGTVVDAEAALVVLADGVRSIGHPQGGSSRG